MTRLHYIFVDRGMGETTKARKEYIRNVIFELSLESYHRRLHRQINGKRSIDVVSLAMTRRVVK